MIFPLREDPQREMYSSFFRLLLFLYYNPNSRLLIRLDEKKNLML